jgi:hypothetical protein
MGVAVKKIWDFYIKDCGGHRDKIRKELLTEEYKRKIIEYYKGAYLVSNSTKSRINEWTDTL